MSSFLVENLTHFPAEMNGRTASLAVRACGKAQVCVCVCVCREHSSPIQVWNQSREGNFIHKCCGNWNEREFCAVIVLAHKWAHKFIDFCSGKMNSTVPCAAGNRYARTLNPDYDLCMES